MPKEGDKSVSPLVPQDVHWWSRSLDYHSSFSVSHSLSSDLLLIVSDDRVEPCLVTVVPVK